MDSALSEKMGALDEKMDNYYSEYKKSVKRLERDVGSLEDGLENLDEYVVEDLDECVDRETVVDLIHEIVLSLIGKKGSRGAVLRKSEDIPHKQRRKARPRKVKQIVV
ncbi:hypothetical protein RhiirA1_402684 [Rhizophagus irregularis]|uniref:Uncharacterized protein n=1 Tax=Rhizophagus irregularis TaxID=588596 RepID=A0A2N0QXD9_9GLOM|nr:hypothetical protein RhiirA1_402684 [Rhizophagus irregularis]